MNLPDWLRRLASSREPFVGLSPRRERRAAARKRHEAGGEAWSPDDRHLNPDGAREVEDVTPRTPGWGGKRRIGGR